MGAKIYSQNIKPQPILNPIQSKNRTQFSSLEEKKFSSNALEMQQVASNESPTKPAPRKKGKGKEL